MSKITQNTTDLRAILEAVKALPEAGGGTGELQELDVTPSHEAQEFIPAEGVAGYKKVTVKPVPRVPFASTKFYAGVYDGNNLVEIPMGFSVGVSVAAEMVGSAIDYEVQAVDGAAYGFALNDNGYYESQSKGVDNGYSLCKVVFNAETDTEIVLSCINWSETSYDFGLISELDTMLSLSSDIDATGVNYSFTGVQAAFARPIPLIIPAGEHFICIKYRKNNSGNNNNDSFQFKIAV